MTETLEIDGLSLRRRLAETTDDHRPWLLDVRQGWEVAAAPFACDRHIPMDKLAEAVDDLPAERDIVVVCAHGQRSLMVARWLRHNGWPRAYSLAGGTAAWETE
ncbi:MAG: rhodanese-like domain-containing protein [Alphaproteobacteria bacterium]